MDHNMINGKITEKILIIEITTGNFFVYLNTLAFKVVQT